MRYTITNKLVTNTKTNNSLGKLKITLEFHETPYQFNINHDAAIFFFHGGDKPILLENILGEVHLDFMCQPDKNGFYDSQTRELMKNCVTNLEEKIKQYKTK